MSVRILLADDHQIVRQGLRFILEDAGFEVAAEAEDGHSAVRLARDAQPDVAVLDLMMPLLNGIAAAREIRHAAPDTRPLLLTTSTRSEPILEALDAGVRGFVLKSHGATDLVQAIREVMRGGTYLSPGVSHAVIQAYRNGQPTSDPLTPRERQVLQLIGEGKRTREIAELLCISVKTAESHRSHIMKKLGVRETAGLVRHAIRLGLATL